jgi:uncharacterized glyoxalase superfamily metalloenzyme YdcJ
MRDQGPGLRRNRKQAAQLETRRENQGQPEKNKAGTHITRAIPWTRLREQPSQKNKCAENLHCEKKAKLAVRHEGCLRHESLPNPMNEIRISGLIAGRTHVSRNLAPVIRGMHHGVS